VNIQMLDKKSKRYAVMYVKGWRASGRCDDGMDAAESRFLSRNKLANGSPEHWAWEDGWLDMAAGRDMWHLRDCENHHNNDGGCGVA
jgi:hypothetical protein